MNVVATHKLGKVLIPWDRVLEWHAIDLRLAHWVLALTPKLGTILIWLTNQHVILRHHVVWRMINLSVLEVRNVLVLFDPCKDAITSLCLQCAIQRVYAFISAT